MERGRRGRQTCRGRGGALLSLILNTFWQSYDSAALHAAQKEKKKKINVGKKSF